MRKNRHGNRKQRARKWVGPSVRTYPRDLTRPSWLYVIVGWIRAGESILAVAKLIELAAQNRKPIRDDLRVAVQTLVDEDTFDADERREW